MSKRAGPPVVDVVVELGVKRINAAVGPSPGESYLPRLVLWVDQASGMVISFDLIEPAEDYTVPVLTTIDKLISVMQGLPREIRIRDVELGQRLQALLQKLGIAVVVREDLPGLDAAFESMEQFRGLSSPPEPGLLDVPGMTLDHLHAFAEAAKAFFEAKPWKHLSDSDLIQIESSEAPRGAQLTVVLGNGGQTFGLGFFASRKSHEEMQAGMGMPKGAMWSLQFGDIDSIPFADGESWEQYNLPVAGRHGYPSFLRYMRSKPPVEPKPEELIWAEGLLRAIAAATEDEIDAGRFEKTVDTFQGPATYRLSLPILLDQMAGKKPAQAGSKDFSAMRRQMELMLRGLEQNMQGKDKVEIDRLLKSGKPLPEFKPVTDADKAQLLVEEARQSRGRREIQLVRQALAIDPNCVDALLVLAERESELERAMPLLQRAVDAGERALGPEFFQENAGHFWGILETRPYMRARSNLARALLESDCAQDAADHYRELLRLNPNDNQGNRYPLAQALLKTNDLDQLDDLLNRAYPEDVMAEWAFTRALLEFRRRGDSAQARQRLADATAANPHVVPLLLGKRQMPMMMPSSYQPGGKDEAALTVNEIIEYWAETPEAIEWLEKTAPKASPKKKGKPKRRK